MARHPASLPRPYARRGALAAAALAATLALSGCGGDHEGHEEVAQGDTSTSTGMGAAGTGAAGTADTGTADTGTAGTGTAGTGTAGTADTAKHNSADVAFVQGMIPHHQQAIEMAALAKGRTTNKAILKLATQIHGAQDPEIKQMTAWLEAWGEELPAGVEAAHAEEEAEHKQAEGEAEHGHAEEEATVHAHEGEGGMMTAAQMAGLKKLKGKAFDKQFLTLMIAHHAGAVESANTTIARGLNPDVKKLCRAIVRGQTAEITLMKKLLKA